MTAPHVVIDTLTRTTAFGLGLWDDAAGRLVSDGLDVRVHALAGTRLVSVTAAVANRAGVFVAHGVPGLRDFEAGAGDDAFWATPWPTTPYLVEVRDAEARYLPFVMRVQLPAPRGRVLPACVAELWPPQPPSSPPAPPAATANVPLFPLPARRVPAGFAAVRATLRQADTRLPAAYAVLEVRFDGRLLARGVADARGEVLALFPYPEPPLPPLTPASPPTPPLALQTWGLAIVVRYRPSLPLQSPDPARAPLPDLCELLAQPEAVVATGSPPAALTEAMLRYGEDLLLGADAGAELFISPA